MGWKKRVIVSSIITIIISGIAVFLPMIPCKIGLSIPQSTYHWGRCNLNLFNLSNQKYDILYFGVNNNTLTIFIALFLAIFLISFFILKLNKKGGK